MDELCNMHGESGCSPDRGWIINGQWYCGNHWSVIGQAEFARFSAEVERLATAARRLIAYRDAAGALNFQLEKADDFINELRAAIARAEGG